MAIVWLVVKQHSLARRQKQIFADLMKLRDNAGPKRATTPMLDDPVAAIDLEDIYVEATAGA